MMVKDLSDTKIETRNNAIWALYREIYNFEVSSRNNDEIAINLGKGRHFTAIVTAAPCQMPKSLTTAFKPGATSSTAHGTFYVCSSPAHST